MSRIQKYTFSLAIFMMSLAMWLPIWRIEIWAPQYPEGLSMQISASQIYGNVAQINILNHYIGMKKIVPEQIPELSLIPWLLAFVLILGMIVVLIGRLFLAKIWFGLVSVLSAAGLADFYRWGYEYGHNLDPDAPIKIPGLSYQPPLLGFKQILNIEAYSIPDWGAYALALGLGLAGFSIFFGHLVQRDGRMWVTLKRLNFTVPLFLLSLALTSCKKDPEPLTAYVDHCEHCHMQISDTRFGAEIITEKGRIYKFDSIKCLQDYVNKNSISIQDIFVADYLRPSTLVESGVAYFLIDGTISGPMGVDVVASKDRGELENLKSKKSGKVTNWKGLSSSSF